jgi:hypothetical protein
LIENAMLQIFPGASELTFYRQKMETKVLNAKHIK